MSESESDFYGDADAVSDLHRRVDDFAVEDWIQQQLAHPGRLKLQQELHADTNHLHNPYAGVPYAWQLTETLDSFITRLPPATTDQDENVPWIFICNPYIPRVDKHLASNQMSIGNTDEAPEEEGTQVTLVSEGGAERLEIFSNFMENIQKTGKTKSIMSKEINKEREQACADILDLAHAAKVRTGKWMLFCQTSEVNMVWEAVAKATASNELGIAAKVAPRPQFGDLSKDRLICIYTTDFKDQGDVGRVLQRLREMRLVEARGRPIYYKPDAFTYIGIASGNSWGIKASIYSSKDII